MADREKDWLTLFCRVGLRPGKPQRSAKRGVAPLLEAGAQLELKADCLVAGLDRALAEKSIQPREFNQSAPREKWLSRRARATTGAGAATSRAMSDEEVMKSSGPLEQS